MLLFSTAKGGLATTTPTPEQSTSSRLACSGCPLRNNCPSPVCFTSVLTYDEESMVTTPEDRTSSRGHVSSLLLSTFDKDITRLLEKNFGLDRYEYLA